MNDRDLNVSEQYDAIEKGIEKALQELDLIQKERSLVKTSEELEALERRIIEATDNLAGALVAQEVQDSIKSKELKDEAAHLVRTYPKKMKNQGLRDVTIRPSRGEPFTVKTIYFSQKGKRKQNRVGCYPELILLGVYDRCTSRLASEVSLTTVAMSSFEEAEKALADRGICLDGSTIRNITIMFAARARRPKGVNRMNLWKLLMDVALLFQRMVVVFAFVKTSGVRKQRKVAIGIPPTGGSQNFSLYMW